MKIVITSGGFDPPHSGHISYLNAAKSLGDLLIVGINSDAWLIRKKGRAFMPLYERRLIISNLISADITLEFDDSDGSACDLLKKVQQTYPKDTIIFANGGDRTVDNIPEMVFNDVEFVFGVGGADKKNSSSWILDEWKAPRTQRDWGNYRVLYENGQEVKVKELTVEPGQRLSMQRHTNRAEHWFVAEGTATVYTVDRSTDLDLLGHYQKFDSIHIQKTQWHQLCNETDQPLRVVEIQYGQRCVEEDIERQ